MKTMRVIKWVILLFGALSIIIFPVQASWAGGGSGASNFKGKIQQKLQAPRNVQYEPYYLKSNSENEYWGDPQQQQVQQADESAQRQEGFQRSSYDANTPAVPQAAGIAAGGTGNRDRLENKAPVPSASTYAIYNMKYTSELEENVVTVKGEITFEVFNKNGPTQLPLVSNNVGLIDVRVNKGASFVTSQGGMYYLIMNKPGRYNLDFEFLIKATREREHGPGSFSVDVVPAPISQFEFIIAEKDTQIFIEPAIKVETTAEENRTIAWAVLPNANRINVRWTKALPKEEIVSAVLEPKVYAESSTYSTIGGGVISSTTNIVYSILQAEVSSLRVAIPEDVSVLDVKGNELRDWKVSTKEGTQYIDVFLNFGVKGGYNLNFTYERKIAEGSGIVQMPWVKTMNTERESGYYGIAASTNVELAVKNVDKVTTIDTKQLPAVIWGSSNNPILLAFKYLNPPFDITIEVTRHEELPVLVAAIDSANHVTLQTKDGKVLTKVTYQVRNNVKQFLRFDLPSSSKIWSAFVAGKPVKPAMDKQGHVLLPLEKSQMQGRDLTQFPVEVVYLTEGTKFKTWGGFKLQLPKVDVPINQSYWSLYLPYDYTYYNFDTDMRKLDQPSSMNFMQRGLQGRLRSAADDIGDQFSPGQSVAQSFVAESKEMSARGILPITINVPQEGKVYNFSKLLVVDGEAPWVSVRYSSILEKIARPVRGVVGSMVPLVMLALMGFFIYKFLRRITRPKSK